MIIKMKLTKTEVIRAILDYWDPCRAKETPKWYFLFYNYEAETLAQYIRKNSSVSTVARHIKELIDDKLRREDCGYEADMENAERVAASMIMAVKKMN